MWFIRQRNASLIAWSFDLGVGIIALFVYLWTLAPTIVWEHQGADSGELVAAAYTYGIPHPPGYPLYTLAASVFARLPLGESAQNVAFFSALTSALVIVLFARILRHLFRAEENRAGWLYGSAASVALGLAFAPAFWAQATIPEVYALHALIVTFLLTTMVCNSEQSLVLAAVAVGLGAVHHLTLGLLLPGLALMLFQRKIKRAVMVRAGLGLGLPLLAWLYFPLRAGAHPPILWGDPGTLEGFGAMVSAAIYRPYLFELTWMDIFARGAAVLRLLFEQFQLWGVILGLWGIARMWQGPHRRLAVAIGLDGVLLLAFALFYASRDSSVNLLPVWMIFALWIGYGLMEGIRVFAGSDLAGRAMLVAGLFILPAFNLVMNFPAMNLSQNWRAWNYAQAVWDRVPPDALVLAEGDEHLFALQYFRYVVRPSANIDVVSAELLQFDWYARDVAYRLSYWIPVPVMTPSAYSARLSQIIGQSLAHGRRVFTTGPCAGISRYIDYPCQPYGSAGLVSELLETK